MYYGELESRGRAVSWGKDYWPLNAVHGALPPPPEPALETKTELIEEGPGKLVRSRITGPGERTTKSYVPRRLVNLGAGDWEGYSGPRRR